ncbi:divalent-cation tolerance protein CutA [Dankookia rubra]|uniref:Divalent-cation tolerance protein CutA n=1 Tax=Dankookia rubra TaxID=1442381 RepID=A0A4R5QKR7_9PROT|nr:divalent-cation tolerance protein CutA [Dankookia rubra]TDH64064.1 divalent-cation tolerance protein CutA [Dankookia rubra]
MTDAVLWVWVTASDAEEATTIGRALVREGLAACVNILPGHTAIYRDAGVLREAEETAFVAKTTAAQFEPLRARIRALHSYELPAILALPAMDGDPDFVEWIRAGAGAG